jgi:hypothetical protein
MQVKHEVSGLCLEKFLQRLDRQSSLFANAVINPDSACAHLDGLDTHMRVDPAGSSQAIDAASFQVRVNLQHQLPICSKTHIGIWFFLQSVPIQSLLTESNAHMYQNTYRYLGLFTF